MALLTRKERQDVIDAAVRRVDVPAYWREWIAMRDDAHRGIRPGDFCRDCYKRACAVRAEFDIIVEERTRRLRGAP